MDTYGLAGDNERGLGVMVELYYRDDIVKDGKQVVASKNRSFKADQAITW